LVAITVIATGCGSGVSTAPMKAPDKDVAGSTGRVSVPVPDGPSTPLIVDWQPEQRTDLEAAIRDGVVVVRLDKKGLRILPGCKVSHGDYGYVGVVTKKEVIQLKTAQQVAANLPLTGGLLGAELGGELSRGATLDIRLAIVGKHATTWTEVTARDLAGGKACAPATHYIRGITVGAFTMKMNAEEKAKGHAKVLGQGGDASHDKSSAVDSSDGKLEDCERADPDAMKPPGQCRALVRIQLEPIAKGGSGKIVDVDPQPQPTTCPEGMVFVDGKCAEPVAEKPHTCKPDDATDCQAQCDKGDAASCQLWAALLARDLPRPEEPSPAPGGGLTDVAPPSQASASASASADSAMSAGDVPVIEGRGGGKVQAALVKSCDLGNVTGCANLGRALLAAGQEVPRAMLLLEKTCQQGEASACNSVADAYWHGPHGVKRSIPRALKLFDRACNGGDAIGCTNEAVLYAGADGVKKDDKKSLALSMRACGGGVATACGNAGARYEFGMGVPRDVARAASLYDRACRKDPGTCIRMGILHATGQGAKRDPARAKELFGKTCRATSSLRIIACWVEKNVYGGAGGEAATAAEIQHFDTMMRQQCEQGSARGCAFMGVLSLIGGKEAAGRASLARACKMKDPWGCDLAKRRAGNK
jgi:TPR repeat protein